jgi:hypothetical protein
MNRFFGTPFLLWCLAVPCTSLSQTNPGWSNLSALRPGQKIQVVETNSKKHTGIFVNVSDTAIASRDNAGEQTFRKPEVRSVKLMENGHRMRHVLIGAAVGAGVGAGVTAAGWEQHGFLGGKGAGAAVGAVIGGVVGAIVGALLPSHKTIYSVSSH